MSQTYGGHDYLFCTLDKNWDNARSDCQGTSSMDLAHVDDSAENDFIRSHLGSSAWIGGNDKTAEGTWLWAADSTVFWHDGPVSGKYANWSTGQPDSNLQDCSKMSRSDGRWSDEECGGQRDYVCEMVPPPSPPPPPADADTGCWDAAALQAGAPWPMRGLCPMRRGAGKFIGSQVNTVNWVYSTGLDIRSSAAIGADGTIYFGSDDDYVYAINPNGSLKWRYKTVVNVQSSPALGANGMLYVGSDDDYLYALDAATGALRWKYNTTLDIDSSPAIGPDGTVYVGSDNDRLYAFNGETGAVLWSYQTGLNIDSSPAIGPDGTIYIGSDDNYLYALRPDLGLSDAQRLRWKTNLGADVNATPAIGPAPDHAIYIRTQAGKIYKLGSADGHVINSYTGPNDLDTDSSPAIGLDGDIYVGIEHKVFAFKPDLTVKWQYQTGNDIKGSPAIGADGTVYIGSDDRKIYALRPADGTVIWSLQSTNLGGAFRATPAIGKNGTVYVGCGDHKLYSIGTFACTPSHPCSNGMGPCSADNGCVAGLVCGQGIAPKFGLPDDFGVCWDRTGCFGASSPDCGGYRSKCGTCDPGCSGTAGLAAGAPWPMAAQCPQGRGLGELSLASTPPTVLWTSDITVRTTAEPVIAADGTFYFGNDDGDFYALNRDSTVRWSIHTGGKIVSAAALAATGDVYFGSLDGHVYAANAATGQLTWAFTAAGPVEAAVLVAPDGTIYAGDTTKIWAIDPVHGTARWSLPISGKVIGTIALSNDGTAIYFNTADKVLRAVSTVYPLILWQTNLETSPLGGPMVTPTDDIIVTSPQVIYQYDPLGKIVSAKLSPDSTPWVCSRFAGNNRGLVAVTQSNIFYQHLDSFPVWQVPAQNSNGLCPTLTSSGMVGFDANRVCFFREVDGVSEWCAPLPAGRTPTTSITTNDNTMSMGSDHGMVTMGNCGSNITCKTPEQCIDHKCVCAPNCSGKSCGDADGCGGHCGNCGDGELCQANADCTAGLQCVLAPDNVHRCTCVPNCAGKHCGDSAGDGCGGTCVGFCGDHELDCHTNSDCPVGDVCGTTAGEHFGSSGHTACWPVVCDDFVSGRTDCGTPTSPCGTCGVCERQCLGRDCGPDGCGGSCGTCNGGICTGSLAMGECEQSQYETSGFYPSDMPAPAPQGGGHFIDASLRGDSVGRVPGEPGVSEQGTATYSIPLVVPPGREGFEPSLALNYDSTRGDGYVGRGWGLDGFPLSAISRCNRGVSIGDPAVPSSWQGPVAYNPNDRFCLDGQLLIAVSGTYGADGTEYRTEVESFKKVISYGGSSNPYSGPEYFRVWTKDGLVFTYGDASRDDVSNVLLDTGAPIRRAWAVNQVVDRGGSVMTVDYDNLHCSRSDVGHETAHCGTRELLPKRITYGAGDRHIEFVYDKHRPDRVDGFQSGAPVTKSYALQEIQTWADSVHVRSYRLSYMEPWEDPNTSKSKRAQYYSIVKTIEDCTPTDPEDDEAPLACKPPTVFRYDEPRGLSSGHTHPTSYAQIESAIVLDFDGDGADDLLYESATSGTVHVLFGTKNSESEPFRAESETNRLIFGSGCSTLGALDFDGDSKDDVAVLCQASSPVGAGLFFWLSDGSGFRGVVATNITSATKLLDSDGDGIPNALSSSQDWSLKLSSSCRAALQQTPPGFPSNPQTWPAPMANCSFQSHAFSGCLDKPAIDLDGNGIVDLGCDPSDDDRPKVPIDFNGDGLKDLAIYDETEGMAVLQALNTGGGESVPIWKAAYASVGNSAAPSPNDFNRARAFDVNGDGREDLLLPDPTEFSSDMPRYRVWLVDPASLGLFPSSVLDNEAVQFNDQMWPGDFNGDGAVDLARSVNGGFRIYWNRNAMNGALRVVRDGLGNVSKFAYAAPDFGDALESSSPYTAEGGCEWPLECNRRAPNTLVALMETHTGALPLDASNTFAFQLNNGQTQVETFTRYGYAGGRTYAPEERWLGFHQRTIETLDPVGTSVLGKLTLEFDNSILSDGPVPTILAGTPVRTITELTSDGSALNESRPISYRRTTTQLWEEKASAADRPFVYLKEAETTREATDGASTSSITVSSYSRQVDEWDNLEREQVERADGTSEVTDIDYEPADTSLWKIGLPSLWDETSVAPGATHDSEHHTVEYDYYANGLPHHVTQEPNFLNTVLEDDVYLKTTISRDLDHFYVISSIEQSNAQDEVVRRTTWTYDGNFIFPRTETVWTGTEDLVTKLHYDDGHGGILTAVDPNGLTTQWQYDAFANLHQLRRSTGSVTTMTIEPAESISDAQQIPVAPSFQVTTQSSDGSAATIQYDSAGNARRIRRRGFKGAWVNEELGYDARGRVVTRARPHVDDDQSQGVAQFSFDNLNRLITASSPDGTQVQHMYAPAGLASAQFDGFAASETDDMHAFLDEVGNLSVDITDVRGLQTARFERHGTQTSLGAPTGFVSTRYQYGPFGQLQEAFDPEGNQTSLTYDPLGRVETRTEPDMGAHRYDYYPTGRLRARSAVDGTQRVQFVYDNLGRMTERDDAEGATTWQYDGPATLAQKGQLVSSTTGVLVGGVNPVVVNYDYEPATGLLSRVRRNVEDEEFAVEFRHTPSGQISRLIYPAAGDHGFEINYEYDVSGALQRVRGAGASDTYWELREAHEGFQPSVELLGTQGLATHTSYEPLTGRIATLAEGTQSNPSDPTTFAPSKTLEYQYFDNGNVRTRRADKGSIIPAVVDAYHYDGLSRLTDVDRSIGASTPSPLEHFDYHRDGRLEHAGQLTGALGSPLTTMDYGYDQLPHAASAAGANTYGYDPSNGNQTSREGADIPGGAQTIEYATFDMPRVITTGLGTDQRRTVLHYDADQHRVLKRGEDTTTVYFDGLYERVQSSGATSGNATHIYRVYAGDRAVAEVERAEAAGHSDPSTDDVRYIHPDHLGTPHLITDAAGAVLSEPEYRTFGEQVNGPAFSVAGFASHQLDDDVGLVDMGGRLYDPKLHHFITGDPFVSRPFATQGMNRYAYVENNPVNWTDPSGFDIVICTDDPLNPHCRTQIEGGGGGGGGGGGDGAKAHCADYPFAPGCTRTCLDGSVVGSGQQCPNSQGGGGGRGGREAANRVQADPPQATHDRATTDNAQGTNLVGSTAPRDPTHGTATEPIDVTRLNGGPINLLTETAARYDAVADTVNELSDRWDPPETFVSGRFFPHIHLPSAVEVAEQGAITLVITAVLKIPGATVAVGRSVASKILARNLKLAGLTKVAGEAAHHIVAFGAKAAAPAQAVLKRYGIGINDAANGVFLPQSEDVANEAGAAIHNSLHTADYYKTVNDMLVTAGSKGREEVLEALDTIRKALREGGL